MYFYFYFTVGGMSRPSKAVTQAKKVAPPAVPNDFRHSGSSFGSAGYASSEDGGTCYLAPAGVVPPNSVLGQLQQQQQQHLQQQQQQQQQHQQTVVIGNPGDEPAYGMLPAGKSPGPMFSHPGFTFPSMVSKYAAAHAEDQGKKKLLNHSKF